MNLARQAVIEQQPDIHAALWPSLSTMADRRRREYPN